MKKKLISFLMVLCLVAVPMPMLTSCDSGAGVDQIQHRRAATIVIHFIVEEGTTPEAIAAVRAELSAITESRFTTRLELVGVTASEYDAVIARALAAHDAEIARQEELASIARSIERASREQARADREAGIPTVRTPRPTEPPRTTALYTERIEYPAVRPDQIDIFFINSDEMFLNLMEEDRLEQLDDELNTRAKILREYIHPSILMAGRHHERTFAIPTNRIVGQATWLAINRRLADQYELDISRVRDWRDLGDWLELVGANEPGIVMVEGGPVFPLAYESDLFPEFGHYFPIQAAAGRTLVFVPEQMPTEPPPPLPTEPLVDSDGNIVMPEEEEEPTIPQTTLPPRAIPSRLELTPDPIAVSNQYTSAMWTAFANLNQRLRENGLFETGTAGDDRERAVYQIQGTLEDLLERQAIDLYHGFDYEYVMIQNPIAGRQQLRSAMFGISASTPNVGRAMEILTLLNTNRQFKNIFTYGVEGVHWVWNEDRQIERLNNDYMVDINHTGNNFIADLLAGENPRRWVIAKEHNLSVVNSVFMNFNFDRSRVPVEFLDTMNSINAFGLEIRQQLLHGFPAEFETADDFIWDFVTPRFEDLGVPDFIRALREIINPEG